jgi:hypothetical protein
MKFHFPSFLLGFGAGGASVMMASRLRPLLVEVAATVYRLADAITVHAATRREDLQDLLAEARARARGLMHRQPRPVA